MAVKGKGIIDCQASILLNKCIIVDISIAIINNVIIDRAIIINIIMI